MRVTPHRSNGRRRWTEPVPTTLTDDVSDFVERQLKEMFDDTAPAPLRPPEKSIVDGIRPIDGTQRFLDEQWVELFKKKPSRDKKSYPAMCWTIAKYVEEHDVVPDELMLFAEYRSWGTRFERSEWKWPPVKLADINVGDKRKAIWLVRVTMAHEHDMLAKSPPNANSTLP